MKSLSESRLYAFVDTAYLNGREPRDVAAQLCDGGADVIQLRAKGWPPSRVLTAAADIAPVANRAGVWFVVNDHPDVAAQVGAPLCHLGQEDFFDAGQQHVSDVLPQLAGLACGLSSHSPDQALRAVAAGAAYLGVGPVFATPTKPGRAPVTLDYVRWAAANLTLPWFAIGGITLDNLDQVLAAGATRICVVSAILQAPDIARACQSFRDRLTSAPA